MTHLKVRAFLVDELKKDLLGPGKPDEELLDRPTVQYLAGILYPVGSDIEAEEDDGFNEAEPEDDDVDIGTLIATATNPSALGLTFTTRLNEELIISVRGATYQKIPDPVNAKRDLWKRQQMDIPDQVFCAAGDFREKRNLVTGLRLTIRGRKRDDHCVVTISLSNNHSTTGQPEAQDLLCFFQPELIVRSGESGKAVFLAHGHGALGVGDVDREINALLYRHVPEYAVGHNCAVDWEAKEGHDATQLQTVIIPSYQILQLSPDPASPSVYQQMLFLSEAKAEDLVAGLNDFLDSYRNWILARENEIPALPAAFHTVAGQNINRCHQTAKRIQIGINLIEQDPLIRRAFQMANRAMLIQRSRIEWIKSRPDNRTDQPILSTNHIWRPFQLAFILMCLASISNPHDPDRSMVDLLWFPTGGGKTEAYLGLTAFTLFLRRLRTRGQPEGYGVTVLMRYTLRLLTLQQFQRAASLIMACETLRRESLDDLGEVPVSLGLWVGGGATPNKLEQAQIALEKLISGEKVLEGNPYQILNCPWCGTPITPRNYRVGASMSILCPNAKCDFNDGMPLYLVDDDIYQHRPTLLIGTVDKFARMPWLSSAGAIFGNLQPKSCPPELIIQDELHLISGPLGTLVGLYETAIDLLCQMDGCPPKVIASTATIRRAAEQAHSLFNRPVNQFPAPGLDVRDSFFAHQVPEEEKPGRLYIGIHAPGKSIKTTLLRVYASLLQRIFENNAELDLRDPYWTLVSYFNSLRELGGAVRLVEDDVRERMKVIADKLDGKPHLRFLNDVRELNSHTGSDEIPNILKAMEEPASDHGGLDVLMATNMISVGVDVDRLGLMVVNGQPKMSAEYIQATSRIGRKYPGLVVTVYNWTRPRDRSHYERFCSYHSAIYSHVEPTSVTPFSSRARDRGLHGVFITLIRHLDPVMNPENAAARFNPESPVVQWVKERILERVAQVDPDEVEATREELDDICARWDTLSEGGTLYYGMNTFNPGQNYLIFPAERIAQADTLSFPTLNSLRDVEGETGLFLAERKHQK